MTTMSPAEYTLEALAGLVNGSASVAPGPIIRGMKPVEFAGPEDLTYITGADYLEKLNHSRAAAVLVSLDLEPTTRAFIRVANPEAAFARLTAVFYPHDTPPAGVSPKADVDPSVSLGRNVSIGAFAVVGPGVVIEDDAVIGTHTVIDRDCRIGSRTRIFPHVTLYRNVVIGSDVIIHAGCVIGADGFGYALEKDVHGRPTLIKKYHSGSVEIGDGVELGAMTAVDRALADVTRIGPDTKIDNLVQVAHNVTIGQGTVIASQVGIAGSSQVGDYCMIGGQTGIRDHVKIGSGVILAAKVGVYRSIADGAIMAGGVPAMPHKLFLRVQTLFKKLPEMMERLRKLEQIIQRQTKEK